MWICKNCEEEVPDNFSVCWNCQNEIGTSGLNPLGEAEIQKNQIPINDQNFIDFDNISTAGKNLKQAVVAYIISIPLALLMWIAAEVFNMEHPVILFIILGLLMNIIVLSKIYYAGDSLKKCIKPNSKNEPEKV